MTDWTKEDTEYRLRRDCPECYGKHPPWCTMKESASQAMTETLLEASDLATRLERRGEPSLVDVLSKLDDDAADEIERGEWPKDGEGK